MERTTLYGKSIAVMLALALCGAALGACAGTSGGTAGERVSGGAVEATVSDEGTTATDATDSSSAGTSAGVSSDTAASKDASASSSASGGATYDTQTQYTAAVLSDGEALVGGTYTATGTDESAIEASGNVTATVTGSLIQKADGNASSADDSSFKGVNAAVRAYGNATITLTDVTVEASAQNATGVFAYNGATIIISDSTVTVTGGGSGGVQVAGGGTLYGSNLTVITSSKAAIRSDRGGGTLVIDGGTYTSNGKDGCPVIYSTADITVSNATGTSAQSRAVIIEGKNSVTLINSDLSGNDQSSKSGSVRANVLLYQSASGDASVGTSVFTMQGGSLVSNSGAMFYCTNTASIINLEDADLVLSDDGSLLIVSEGRWGKDGSNGGLCTLNAAKQTLEGTIYVDGISTLDLNLTDGSTFTGSIAGEGEVALTLDATSTWILTADSSVTSISGNTAGIDTNGFTLYVNGVAFAG